MPQFEQLSTYSAQIFWLLITFGALYWAVVRFVVPRMSLILEFRANKISSDLKHAEEEQLKADEMLGSYEYSMTVTRFHADNIVRDAREESREKNENMLKALDAEIEVEIEKNIARMEHERKEASEQTEEIVGQLASQIVRRIIKAEPDAKKIRQWVSEVVAKHG